MLGVGNLRNRSWLQCLLMSEAVYITVTVTGEAVVGVPSDHNNNNSHVKVCEGQYTPIIKVTRYHTNKKVGIYDDYCS